MAFFTSFLEQHSLQLEGFAPCVSRCFDFSVCFLFQPGCGVSFPRLASLRPDNRRQYSKCSLIPACCPAAGKTKPGHQEVWSFDVSMVNLEFLKKSPWGRSVTFQPAPTETAVCCEQCGLHRALIKGTGRSGSRSFPLTQVDVFLQGSHVFVCCPLAAGCGLGR